MDTVMKHEIYDRGFGHGPTYEGRNAMVETTIKAM